jgi:hypothetical protein
MANKKITTSEGLAEMVQRPMASKKDLKASEDRLTARLDRIEHLLLEEQKRKIENLEARMKKLEDALAVYLRAKGLHPLAAVCLPSRAPASLEGVVGF